MFDIIKAVFDSVKENFYEMQKVVPTIRGGFPGGCGDKVRGWLSAAQVNRGGEA